MTTTASYSFRREMRKGIRMLDSEGNEVSVVVNGAFGAILVPEGEADRLADFLRSKGISVVNVRPAITTTAAGGESTTTFEIIVLSSTDGVQDLLDGVDGGVPGPSS